MNKAENVFIFLMAGVDLVKRIYLKLFPPAAVIFAIIYVAGLAGTSDRRAERPGNATEVIIVALVFTILALLYIIGELKEKEDRRGRG
jgi:hypothetical protein